MALWIFGIAILRILSFGFMPPDDVLRHAAFAVGNRTWDQILIGRPEALFDQAPGWHAILRALHAVAGWGPDTLVTFSIAFCLMAFLASGLLWVRRWEAWMLALGACFLCDGPLALRVALGRPFVLTSALLVCLMGSIRSEKARPWLSPVHALWIAGAALATWIHGSWYLLFLLPAAVLLAGHYRESLRLGFMLLLGCLLGASFTGHPLAFLQGQLSHLFHALARHAEPRSLAMEFLPGHQTLLVPLLVVVAGLLNRRNLGWGQLRRDPLLILGILTWGLGYFKVWRFYLDWAFPALALWMALQLDEAAENLTLPTWGRRMTAACAAALFLGGLGWNHHGRWSIDGRMNGLSPNSPHERLLLPKPGGVLYSNSMFVFYGTYFMNPGGQWKYVLGYEPGMMTPMDDQVFQSLYRTQDWNKALAPWTSRMTSKDRLVIPGRPQAPPAVTGLLWVFAPPNKWVGLKPGSDIIPVDLPTGDHPHQN